MNFFLVMAIFTGLFSINSLSKYSLLINSEATSGQQISTKLIANTSSTNVEETAKQITVRIFTEGETGSGVVVAHQGQTYTVLTNAHVIDNNQNQNYQIMTADGVTHNAIRKSCNCFSDLDLAFVSFESSNPYYVAELAPSNVLHQVNTYASGFPAYYFPNEQEIQSTEDWGLRAFRLSGGQAALFLNQPLLQGYQFGYTNEVMEGMSGGPVINDQGQLVAVNGRLKYSVQGASSFTFVDGTQPDPSLYQQMEGLSWGIPVERFQQEVNNLK